MDVCRSVIPPCVPGCRGREESRGRPAFAGL